MRVSGNLPWQAGTLAENPAGGLAMAIPSQAPLSPEDPPAEPGVDITEARRLLDALERDVQGLDGSARDLDVLRAEIEALRRVLHADSSTPEEMQTGLHGMRDRLHDFPEELKGDAFQAGRYLAELGRILGL
jgi:hypothetical protein